MKINMKLYQKLLFWRKIWLFTNISAKIAEKQPKCSFSHRMTPLNARPAVLTISKSSCQRLPYRWDRRNRPLLHQAAPPAAAAEAAVSGEFKGGFYTVFERDGMIKSLAG